MSTSNHPYYSRNDFPPYKLRKTMWWVAPLLPFLGLAYVGLKVHDTITGTKRP